MKGEWERWSTGVEEKVLCARDVDVKEKGVKGEEEGA